jgi:hypothetical protein
MNERSVRDWAWPGFWAGCAWIGLWYAVEFFGRQVWELVIVIMAVVLMAVAVVNLVEYLQERKDQAIELRQSILTMTPDALLMRESRMLAVQSPELAGELARRIGRPDMILFPNRAGKHAQIKIAGSDVTLQFAIKVLQLSNDIAMVAQRQFSDATYLYDANREMPDRKQWVQLNWVWSQEGICQRYVPGATVNTPPMWLPPWNPQRILDNWLLPSDLMEMLQSQMMDYKVEEYDA